MADLSFYNSLVQQSSGGGGTSGTSNYDELDNRPVINVEGEGVVLAELASGVYNIKGGFKATSDSEVTESNDDDLFYVINDGNDISVTWVSGKGFKLITFPVRGTSEDVSIETTLTDGDVAGQLIGEF